MLSRVMRRLKRVEHPVARYLLLRTRGAVHCVARGHLVRAWIIRHYLRVCDEPRLQIGSGSVSLEGWLDSDLISGDIYLDVTRKLPLSDRSIRYAFGEHVIEHITQGEAERLLGELHRVLQPGGVLRLTTPDLKKILAIYEDRNPVVNRADYARFLDRETGKQHSQSCQILNDYMRLWGHQYIYDEEDLCWRLRRAGFGQIRRCEPGESEHPRLRGIERHGGEEWINRAEALSLEATRAN
jgi:predicted SAM-dependent methyltransferase